MKSIIIFGDSFSFPEGNAATNRVYTYAKGFIAQGLSIHVICFSNDYLEDLEGETQGIKYYHPFGQRARSGSFFMRRWLKVAKYMHAHMICRQIRQEGEVIAINLWTNDFLTHMFSWWLSKATGSKLVVERSEHPLRFYESGPLKKMQGKLKLYFETRFCDGILCISTFLMDYFRSKGLPDSKLFLVPSTVDPDRFNTKNTNPLNYRYIGYFGSLSFKRDRIDLLLRAFAKVAATNPDIHLVIGGYGTSEERQKITALIHTLGITEKVNLLSYLKREEIIRYIMNAVALVMVRSAELESVASYPSKLTEFLATGLPVVTTDVGDISLYMKDGESAFLTEPENEEALAEKLNFILNNYSLAAEVGKKGKQLTENVFHYNTQSARILEYIHSL